MMERIKGQGLITYFVMLMMLSLSLVVMLQTSPKMLSMLGQQRSQLYACQIASEVFFFLQSQQGLAQAPMLPWSTCYQQEGRSFDVYVTEQQNGVLSIVVSWLLQGQLMRYQIFAVLGSGPGYFAGVDVN